jgi:hypothetical protein
MTGSLLLVFLAVLVPIVACGVLWWLIPSHRNGLFDREKIRRRLHGGPLWRLVGIVILLSGGAVVASWLASARTLEPMLRVLLTTLLLLFTLMAIRRLGRMD